MAQIDKKHLTSKNMADERQKIDLTNDKTFSKAPLTKDHGIRIAVHKSIEQQRIQKLTQVYTDILTPGSGKSPGGGHANPLQYSCLEIPMDRGAWWAMGHVAKSRTQLKQLRMHA